MDILEETEVVKLYNRNAKTRQSFSILTLSWRRFLSYKNQAIDLLSKSMDLFLYDRDVCHEKIKQPW